MNLIEFLKWLAAIAIVAVAGWYIFTQISMPESIRKIVLIVVVVFVAILAIYAVGSLGGGGIRLPALR